MKKITIIITLIILLAAAFSLTSCTKKTKPAAPVPQKMKTVTKTGEIQWYYSFSEGQTKAKKLNKPVMADFYTNWCGWCKKLDKDTYSDAKVIELSQSFICIKIDGDKNEDLVNKYNVRGYPTILFLSPDGSLIETSVGYAPANEFLNRMRKVLK